MSTTPRNQAFLGKALLALYESEYNQPRQIYNIGQVILVALLQPSSEYPADSIGTFTDYLEYINPDSTVAEPDNRQLIAIDKSSFDFSSFFEPDNIRYHNQTVHLTDTTVANISQTLLNISNTAKRPRMINYVCAYIANWLHSQYHHPVFDSLFMYFKLIGPSVVSANGKSSAAYLDEVKRFIGKNANPSNLDPLTGVEL